jgi:hypothetical protein
MPHTVMTFVAQVKPEKKADPSALLDTIGTNPETNPYVPFRKAEACYTLRAWCCTTHTRSMGTGHIWCLKTILMGR